MEMYLFIVFVVIIVLFICKLLRQRLHNVTPDSSVFRDIFSYKKKEPFAFRQYGEVGKIPPLPLQNPTSDLSVFRKIPPLPLQNPTSDYGFNSVFRKIPPLYETQYGVYNGYYYHDSYNAYYYDDLSRKTELKP